MNKELNQEQQRRKEIEASDLQWIMDSPKGRRFIWRLLWLSEIYNSSFNSDALYMAFREGVKAIGITIMKDIHSACFNQYLLMMEENKDNG